jgi:hypothetical protein
MRTNLFIAALLLLGVVEHIYPDVILVSYQHHGKTRYSEVSRSQSACEPEAGQQVHFLKDYKIVTCESL